MVIVSAFGNRLQPRNGKAHRGAYNKGLKNLEYLRQRLIAITDRFAGFEAQSLNVHVEFPLLKIALPVTIGKTKIAGIKIHDTRMMRLMEVLLHGGTQLNGWRSADIHQAIQGRIVSFSARQVHSILPGICRRHDPRQGLR